MLFLLVLATKKIANLPVVATTKKNSLKSKPVLFQDFLSRIKLLLPEGKKVNVSSIFLIK